MFKGFFQTKKPDTEFKLKPRYYDREKELQKMKELEKQGNYKDFEEYRRERIQHEWKVDRRENKKSKSSKRLIFLIIITLVLILMMYFLTLI